MNEDSYTIKEMLSEFRADTKETLVRIEQQTTKTNGRVSNLENHKAYLWGAFSILTILGGTIIYLSVMAIDTKIQNGIAKALKDNISRIEYEK